MPFLLIGWMPYRLINHAPFIALALSLGLLIHSAVKPARPFRATGFVTLMVLFLLVKPYLAPAAPELYRRYFQGADAVFFLITGAALGSFLAERMREAQRNLKWVIGIVAVTAGIAWFHQFGAATIAAGAVGGWLLSAKRSVSPDSVEERMLPAAALALATAVYCGTLVYGQYRVRDVLPMTAFQRSVSSYLDKTGQPHAMIVAGPDEFLLQAHTGHPVLVETATASLMSYMPRLGPIINRIYMDFYDLDFRYGAKRQAGDHWLDVWEARSASAWHKLSAQYGVAYLIAPAGLKLNLQAVVTGEDSVLYALGKR